MKMVVVVVVYRQIVMTMALNVAVVTDPLVEILCHCYCCYC